MTVSPINEYGSRVNDLNSLVSDLRNIGAQTLLEIPQIAVIGNQSAGKSSLVEAISRITLPRAAGTCTRCPTEIEMAKADEWSCGINLRIEYDHNGAKLPQTSVVSIGEKIRNPDHVEAKLKLAQLAILNVEHIDLAEGKVNLEDKKWQNTSESALDFSKNTICVDVKGPDFTSLSFVDLPGIIQYADKDKSHLINLVDDMIRSYISKKHCLILTVITMSDDFENQAAPQRAREVDPEGIRTIGVLTKPDLVQEEAKENWYKILRNHKYRLHHGYYTTMQKAVGKKGTKQNRGEEVMQLANQWPSIPGDRLGVVALTDSLSTLLQQLLAHQIPIIKGIADARMRSVRDELRNLSEVITEQPILFIQGLCADLGHRIEDTVIEGNQSNEFWQLWHQAEQVFKRDISRTRPEFIVERIGGNGVQSSLSKFWLNGDFHDEEPAVNSVAEESKQPITLAEVKKKCEEARTVELSYVAYRVKEAFYQSSIEDWDSPVERLLESAEAIFKAFLTKIVDNLFQDYSVNSLNLRAQDAVLQLLQDQKDKTMDILEDWRKMQLLRPYTLNTEQFLRFSSKYLSEAKKLRAKTKAVMGGADEHFRQVQASLGALGFKVNNIADLALLTPADEYESELRIMAETLAYFRLSARREFDVVPAYIQYHLFRSLTEDFRSKLCQAILGSPEQMETKAAWYLAEDPNEAKKRAELESEQTILSSAVKLLQDFAGF